VATKKHPCEKGLTEECIKKYPQWALKAFAYKLLYTLLPKEISKNLTFQLNQAMIGPGAIIPEGLVIPPGYVIPPDYDASDISNVSDLPSAFSPEGASNIVVPPDTGAIPADISPAPSPGRQSYVAAGGSWSPRLFLGNTEVTSYLIQVGTYTRIGNRCIISGFVAVDVVGSGVGDLTIRGLPINPVSTSNHRQAVSMLSNLLLDVTLYSIQAQIKETASYIYVYKFRLGALFSLTESNLQHNSNFVFNCVYEI